MDAQLDNRLSSALAVKKVGEKFKAIIDSIIGLKNAFADHDALLAKIQDTRQSTEKSNKGTTEEKGDSKKDLAQYVTETASALSVMATDTKNVELFAQVNYSWSDFMHVRNGLLLDRARLIYKLASANIVELEEKYAVTKEDLAELKQLIDDFDSLNPAPVTERGDKKISNEELHDEFKDLNKLYDTRLDKMMKSLQTKQSTFYSAYNNARNIVNLGVRHEETTKVKKEETQKLKKETQKLKDEGNENK